MGDEFETWFENEIVKNYQELDALIERLLKRMKTIRVCERHGEEYVVAFANVDEVVEFAKERMRYREIKFIDEIKRMSKSEDLALYVREYYEQRTKKSLGFCSICKREEEARRS